MLSNKKNHLVYVTFSIVLTTFPIVMPANASLNAELDKVFGSMSNVTEPGTFNSASRGVISGGRVVIKNKVMAAPDLISMQLPSANGGCGGIDAFGGSFSFINSDQIVQLFRSMASNAAGLAFQMGVVLLLRRRLVG